MGTVLKSLSLLNFFTPSRLEIGLSEFTRLSGYNKATTYRLISELREAGLIEQFGHNKLYRIGPDVLRLAKLREATMPLSTAAQSTADQLSSLSGETCHVALLKSQTLVSISHAYNKNSATIVMITDADEWPLHATSSGLSVLAFSDSKFIEKYLSMPLKRYTAKTMVSPGVILKKLSSIKKLGYSEANGGFEDNVHSFSAPIFDADSRPIGAISIAAPSNRVKKQEKNTRAEQVITAANSLTHAIGGISLIIEPDKAA